MEGKLIIISGPSGVGKSTIRKELINKIDNLWYCISATTRNPRKDEQNGIDYYFLDEKQFRENIENNNFIEYVEVYNGIYYGTLKNKVLEKLKEGTNVILEIDVDGALKVKEKFNDALLIFIAPPSYEELEKRLKERNTDSKDKIKERIEKANYELSKKNEYDYIVVNDTIEKAVNEIQKIITH